MVRRTPVDTEVSEDHYSREMRPDERAVLERAVRRVTEQAANVNAVVDEAMAAGLDGSSPLVVNMKMISASCSP
jgi:hypothetical protein